MESEEPYDSSLFTLHSSLKYEKDCSKGGQQCADPRRRKTGRNKNVGYRRPDSLAKTTG